MLDLASPEWDRIRSSPGGSSQLTAKLLQEAATTGSTDWAELYHQICHQFSTGQVAYYAVPHLVEIARRAKAHDRIWPLVIVGTVAAASGAHPMETSLIPDECRADFAAANTEAMSLTAELLRSASRELADSQQLLGVLAALHGHTNLAMLLFLQGEQVRLSCPMCGEYINFIEP